MKLITIGFLQEEVDLLTVVVLISLTVPPVDLLAGIYINDGDSGGIHYNIIRIGRIHI